MNDANVLLAVAHVRLLSSAYLIHLVPLFWNNLCGVKSVLKKKSPSLVPEVGNDAPLPTRLNPLGAEPSLGSMYALSGALGSTYK